MSQGAEHKEAKAPAEADAKAPEAKAPTEAHAPKASAGSGFFNKLKGEAISSGKGITSKLSNLGEAPEAKESSLLMTPIKIAVDWVHGSVMNALRRTMNVVKPGVKAIEKTLQTVIHPFSQPLNTLFHSINYLKKPVSAITSAMVGIRNLIASTLTTGAKELYEGVLEKPLQRVNYKIEKLPAIGSIIATTTNKVARALGWPLRAIDKTVHWVTSPLDMADAAVA